MNLCHGELLKDIPQDKHTTLAVKGPVRISLWRTIAAGKNEQIVFHLHLSEIDITDSPTTHHWEVLVMCLVIFDIIAVSDREPVA